ncbi:SMAD/FHA domain-containing protein [Syncephalastrum racemosum]|uniref:SMAD/FHA domain-containing protein n=1 Tax=Syncephalastrum racemosum TaxID=13706 RepID=A0A1X2HCB8_SYNRA|nr:SMAD/FHA domain-containing protein [Syncephalastrum racemosum]
MHMRIVPSIDNPNRSLIFDIVERELQTAAVIKVGRFTDRAISSNHISFKSKVVSRSHCELWLGPDGKLYLRDTKSSSGTFVNHVRLSLANQESRAIEIHDGDIVQLGVDYQGGIDEIYRAVKMRFELNRTKKPRPLSYSMSAFNNLRSMTTTLSSPSSFIDSHTHPTATSPAEPSSSEVQVDECCICLYALAPFQALFVAPCSHSYHFKCIRPLLQSYPGFQCPICRCYSDLEASVAVETEEVIEKYGLSRIHSQHTHAPQSISPQDSREEARSTAALDAASASGEALESSASSSSSSPPPPASSDPPLSSTLIPSPSFEGM